MKAYYRISIAWVNEMMNIIDNFWVAPEENRHFTLTALDFWDWIINLKNQEEFDINEEKIMNFFNNENINIVQPKLIELDVMEYCEDDNIVLVDLDKPEIHIWYTEEFFDF